SAVRSRHHRRHGAAGLGGIAGEAAGHAIERFRLPAGLSSTRGGRARGPADLLAPSSHLLVRLAGMVPRALERRRFWSVLDADADRQCVELRALTSAAARAPEHRVFLAGPVRPVAGRRPLRRHADEGGPAEAET